MSLFELLQAAQQSAPVARERLQVLLAHERATRGQPDLVASPARGDPRRDRQARHVDRDKVQVKMERGGSVSTLEIDIEIRTPSQAELALSAYVERGIRSD